MLASAQVTPNIGFDDNNFNYWECWIGHVENGLQLDISDPVPGRQTLITSKKDSDYYGKFPALCPNGSGHSIKLGNENVNAEAERVSYTFTVPASGNYTLIFDYAVVLQDPGHAVEVQPRFTARVFNVSDNTYLDCPSFYFAAGAGLPGFVLSKQKLAAASVYYKPWAKATIDIRGLAYKVLRIEFTTMDCALGGHFGYAYLDVENNDTTAPITGNSYCKNQNAVTLLGPSGFETYTWYNADKTVVLGHERSLTIAPGPPNNTPYVLHVEPFNGLGCPGDLNTVVNRINADFDLQVHDFSTCPGVPADLTSSSVTDGSSALKYCEYFNDVGANDEISNPSAVDSGRYFIRGVSVDGCTEVKAVNVSYYGAAKLDIVSNPVPVNYPYGVDLSSLFIAQPGYTYAYTPHGTKNPLSNYKNITASGKYDVTATTADGCQITKTVKVVIIPPPGIVSTSPNTFTPNGDGINDHFIFSATGFYEFTQLQIYNRSGQLLFTTKSPDQYWDGTYNGRLLPAGVYYWIFNGINDYTKDAVKLGGSIAIIR